MNNSIFHQVFELHEALGITLTPTNEELKEDYTHPIFA
jgi:hypothetical protein